MIAIYIALCVVLYFCVYIAYKMMRELAISRKLTAQNIPCLTKVPLLGDIFYIWKRKTGAPGIPLSVYLLDLLEGIKKMFKDTDMFWISLGSFHYVVPYKPEAAEVLLSHNRELTKSDDYDTLYPVLGNGLLTSPYCIWKKHRRLVSPAFHSRILDEYQQVFHECAEVMADRLRTEIDKPFIDLGPYISKCTFEIITGTAMGIDYNEMKEKVPQLLEMVHKVKTIIFKRMISPWMWPDFIFNLLPDGRQFHSYVKFFLGLVDQEIPKKKKELLENKDLQTEYLNQSSSVNRRRAFCDVLLLDNICNKDDRLSDQDIYDEVVTFTIAGFDTSATCLVFTFYLIGLYPEVQAKVQTELDEIFGDDRDREITSEDVKKMDYLTGVIKESLRLYPPFVFFGRQLQEDLTIRGVTLPKGVRVMVCSPMLHKDPESFPDPEKFDPDRFLTSDRHPFSFIPFSAGARNCIGQAFAMLEIKTVLAAILRKYKVTSLDPRDKIILCPELISQPLEPMRIKIDLRQPESQAAT